MDWMYKSNQGVNAEEYLLGKSVDSAILDSQAEKQRQAQQGSSGAVAVDMTNKIREDPLFSIKQREAAKRKALLENPIRLKQLQQMLQSEVGDKSKKSKKKKEKKSKKEKKHKKSRHKSSSEDSDNSDDSDDLDAKLMEKLKSQALKGREDEVKAVLKGQQYGLIGGKQTTKSRSEMRGDKETNRGHERQTDRRRRDDDHEDTRRNRRGREEDNRSRTGHSSHRNSRRSRSRSPVREERKKPSKMDEAELERRRKEMMDNAKWRDEQRKSRVDKYKHEAAKEDEMERKKSKKAEFFNPLKVASHSSVEDRIKRNIYNIQRTKADLDKNFAKR